ncbi:hypothetical protein GOP47_0018998 [Adiantum capillus-veneris]|uniref:Uncharacterized protein n=1 Tax=Adiantum capillus-veneris TaxID=13818 RepID=A0A9D4UFH7_ADICA|nr:hypothetical protein GOP47_0018998 [Adiantum capillus-veneris]
MHLSRLKKSKAEATGFLRTCRAVCPKEMLGINVRACKRVSLLPATQTALHRYDRQGSSSDVPMQAVESTVACTAVGGPTMGCMCVG